METTTITPSVTDRVTKQQKTQVNGTTTGVNENNILNLITPELNLHSSVKITPEMAHGLLTLNDGNRPVTKMMVERFTHDMKTNKWMFAGNTIKFDTDRVLRDGQHSLMAVIKSGTTQTFNIQTGLHPLSFTVMDIGRVRSAGDVLAIKGYSDHFALAAAIKSVIFFRKFGRLKTHTKYTVVSNQEVEEFSEKERDMKLMESRLSHVITLRKARKGGFMGASIWAFIYFILTKVDKDDATIFINLLASGENLSMQNNTAIYLLREMLIDFNAQHVKYLRMSGSIVTELKLRYVLRAWNAWRNKEKISKLQIDTREVNLEKPV